MKTKSNWIVAAYDCAQAYGGPEEGGWWYDSGSLVRVLRVFHNEDKACEYARRMNRSLKDRFIGPNVGKHDYTSVLSEGMIFAEVYENQAPAGYPEVHPHYE